MVISTLPIFPQEKLDIIRVMNQVLMLLEVSDIKSLRVHIIIEKKWKLKFFEKKEKNPQKIFFLKLKTKQLHYFKRL